MAEKKKKVKYASPCVQSMLGQLSPGQSQSCPSGPVEEPWCISAYDKCARRPYTHQAGGDSLCSMPRNKQRGAHRGMQLTKHKCLASNWPAQPTWMKVSVNRLEANVITSFKRTSGRVTKRFCFNNNCQPEFFPWSVHLCGRFLHFCTLPWLQMFPVLLSHCNIG